ncbi:hypothetical protein GFB49_09525 [Epibacterium sp. SM1979]|uniref:DUF6473 domain-containing protein n=1 Tax=Tritonibacter litoralis TaxID=2662264 RepID=A0A843YCM4_9RHOB|nr:DUF6473 family protein [Tritonibacter litoralis]MQQ08691.1 hypothetical protein [Tritonibacter litoralis]
MSYATGNASASDVENCRYGGSRLSVRGPERPLDQPYLAFLGSTEVYGRFIDTPFPEDVEKLLGIPCVNFAAVNGGLDSYFFDATLRDAAANADVAIVQVMGAQNLSNEFFKVHPRRNDRFLCAHPQLLALFPEVDFTEFHFNRHLLSHLAGLDPERFMVLQKHLQDTWVTRMREMVRGFAGEVVLLWLRYSLNLSGSFAQEPVLVTQEMVGTLCAEVTDVIELDVATAGEADDVAGMAVEPQDLQSAQLMLGPREQHRIACSVAERLQVVI